MNQLIHISQMTAFPNAVYCGRPGKGQSGKFGNPCAVNKKCVVCGQTHTAPGDTIPCYELYLTDRLAKDPEFRQAVYDLDGKPLACFCVSPKRPDAPCHCRPLAAAVAKLHTAKTVIRKKDVDHH